MLLSGASWRVDLGDALEVLRTYPDESVHCCVTGPPYWGLRDYGVVGQIGLEKTPEEYLAQVVMVFRELRRVLRDDGTLWLNLGDTYAQAEIRHRDGTSDTRLRERQAQALNQTGRCLSPGLKPKNLVGIPWRVALSLQADGWYLRSDIIWHKTNPMPESVKDRPTNSHVHMFLLAKSERYYFDQDAVRAPPMGGRNVRDVWTIPTKPFYGNHFGTFPPELVKKPILAGCPKGGIVLDPFVGSGTTGMVALELKRRFIGIDLNPDYVKMSQDRIGGVENEILAFNDSIRVTDQALRFFKGR